MEPLVSDVEKRRYLCFWVRNARTAVSSQFSFTIWVHDLMNTFVCVGVLTTKIREPHSTTSQISARRMYTASLQEETTLGLWSTTSYQSEGITEYHLPSLTTKIWLSIQILTKTKVFNNRWSVKLPKRLLTKANQVQQATKAYPILAKGNNNRNHRRVTRNKLLLATSLANSTIQWVLQTCSRSKSTKNSSFRRTLFCSKQCRARKS